jgi:hypothetical protein
LRAVDVREGMHVMHQKIKNYHFGHVSLEAAKIINSWHVLLGLQFLYFGKKKGKGWWMATYIFC